MNKIDTIDIHKGISNIRFGMIKDEILNRIDSEYIENIDEEGDVEISFPKLNLSFTFWKEYGNKLGIIESERKSSSLLGVNLIGLEKEDIKEFIENKLKSDITEEDGCIHENNDIQEWIDVDEYSLTFWFNNNSLYLISWSCEWLNSDTPKW